MVTVSMARPNWADSSNRRQQQMTNPKGRRAHMGGLSPWRKKFGGWLVFVSGTEFVQANVAFLIPCLELVFQQQGQFDVSFYPGIDLQMNLQ
jgi:hypothetical protein